MDLFKKYDLSFAKILKISSVVVVGLFVLMFALSFLKNSFGGPRFANMMSGGNPVAMYKSSDSYAESDVSYPANGMMKLSTRNIAPISPQSGSTGNSAEDYEVRDYNASIEAEDKAYPCGVLMGLKVDKSVIFENSNEGDTYCNFTFKVETKRVSDIVTIIKKLDPRDFSENTYTIKSQVDDFTSEIEILTKKRSSIDETLKNALVAYDSIASLATKALDAETLAKVIDSKIQTIERLTTERIQINEQLDRMARAKAEQLDRLSYTYFHVNVYENKYVDGKVIKDSWKQALKDMVYSVNKALQNTTVNLLGFLVALVPFIIYALVLIFGAKYGWKLIKMIWNI